MLFFYFYPVFPKIQQIRWRWTWWRGLRAKKQQWCDYILIQTQRKWILCFSSFLLSTVLRSSPPSSLPLILSLFLPGYSQSLHNKSSTKVHGGITLHASSLFPLLLNLSPQWRFHLTDISTFFALLCLPDRTEQREELSICIEIHISEYQMRCLSQPISVFAQAWHCLIPITCSLSAVEELLSLRFASGIFLTKDGEYGATKEKTVEWGVCSDADVCLVCGVTSNQTVGSKLFPVLEVFSPDRRLFQCWWSRGKNFSPSSQQYYYVLQ